MFRKSLLSALLFAILVMTVSAAGAGVDLDGDGKSEIVMRSATGQLLTGRLVNNQFQFAPKADPGTNFRLLGIADFDGNGKSDLAYQNMKQGVTGEVHVWPDFVSTNDFLLRSVKTSWDVQAVGDLDGDGYADLVWRYLGFTADRPDDTGVSYIWFTNGRSVTQVRKRGGAPLNWQLIGAMDFNGDGAADMVYVSPDRQIRLLMATPNRTCANVSAGTIPLGFSVVKLGDFTGNRLGEIVIRNAETGQVWMMQIDATGLTLPAPTANPDDPNASCTPSALSATTSLYIFANAPPTWQFFAAGDLNGDGRTDIVWLLPDGSLAVWLMNAVGKAPTVTMLDNAGVAPGGYAAMEVHAAQTSNGMGSSQSGSFRFFGTYPEQGNVDFIVKGGEQFTVTGAYLGWVQLKVAPTTTAGTVRAAANQLGGRIISQTPRLGLYLLDVGLGRESTFLSAMYAFPWVTEGSAATPNVRGANFTIDFDSASAGGNCEDKHGTIVTNIANRRGGAFLLESPAGLAKNSNEVADQLWEKLIAVPSGEKQVINISLNVDPFGSPPFTLPGGPRRDMTGLCIAAHCDFIGLCTSTCRQRVTRFWTFQQRWLLSGFFEAMEQISLQSPEKADQSLVTIIAGNNGWELDEVMNQLRTTFPNVFKRIVIVGGTDSGVKDITFNHLVNDTSGSMVYACANRVTNSAFTGTCNGTSFAGPEVASVLDLVWRRYPSLTSEQIRASLSEALSARQPPTAVIPQDDSCWTSADFIEEILVIAAKKLPPPALCVGFQYFDWMPCLPDNTQIRNILSRNPPNCVGGALPDTIRTCTYVPLSCQYSLSNTGTSIPSGGGSGRISVSTTIGCSWMAATDPGVAWLTILTGATGVGSDVVSWSASGNPGSAPRSAAITVRGLFSGQNFVQATNFIQAGAATCSFTVSTASDIPATGGAGSVAVISSAPNCGWVATSDSSWLNVVTGSGTGSGQISFTTTANPNASPRTGLITVGGQTVAVTQAGSCSYSVTPTMFSFTSRSGAGTVLVDTTATCPWLAASNVPWIHGVLPTSYIGPGGVTFFYGDLGVDNTVQRTGTLTIAGKTVTVIQEGNICTYSVTLSSQSFSATGGAGTATISTLAGCPWTAAGGAFIDVGSTSGTGSGTIAFAVMPNSTSSTRSGTITIQGQSFTITQAGTTPTCTVSSIAFTSNPSGFGAINGAITPALSGVPITCTWLGSLGSTTTRNTTTASNGSFTCSADSAVAFWSDPSITITAAVTACGNVSVSRTY